LSYTIHLFFQMQRHVISFYGVTSRIRFMFLFFPPSIPELKVVTCYKQFGTKSIIDLMFLESQWLHK